jgi:hypothetical protein
MPLAEMPDKVISQILCFWITTNRDNASLRARPVNEIEKGQVCGGVIFHAGLMLG